MDEQRLLENLRRRKRGALEKAIEQYTPYVTVVVCNIIGHTMAREDVEEVVASVFVSLWQHAAELNGSKGNIRAYLGTMARNSAKNKLRACRPHLSLDGVEATNTAAAIAPASDEPYAEVERREQRMSIWGMIRELGEPDSEIFLRYYYYEQKVRDIAAFTGLPASTVKTKLARGRQKLKEMIERDERL